MKRIKIAGILLGLLILLSQCTDTPSNTLNDNPSKFQSQYNPEAFTNVIPYPFTVNWQEGEKGYSKELESTYYEYPLRWTTDFNPDALAERHPNRLTYKLLAVPGANDGLTFYLLKFLGSGDTQSPDLQWKSPTTFTGRVYLINTDNERLLAQQYKKGDLIGNINKITKEEFQAFTEGKQRMAEDCYTITTYHYTDWYRLYADGTMEFLDRQLNDVSHETVCMGGGSGGGPIGGGGGTGGPGSGGTGGGGGTGGLGSGGTGGGGDNCGDPVHGCSGRDEIDDKVVTWDENLILNIPDPGDIINSIDNYLTCFNNKQDAKINIYIDQPTPNSRDTWSGSALNPNVGHTFISIQQGSITRVFGFYPTNGINPFTNPSGNSSLIDDSNHSYDVKVSKRITSSQLSVILSRTKNYNSIYNLNDYNCTDFAIEIGNSAGISLPSSSGNWPGGSGSNPGDLGEDVRAMSPNSNITINTGGGTAVSNTGSCN